MRWDDVDLKNGIAVSQAEDNKGRRDVRLPLHPIIVQHLGKLTGSFGPYVFPWNHNRRTLWTQFHKIQKSAVVQDTDEKGSTMKPMPQAGKEGWYGFQNLQRGFATENAAEMDLFELQQLMQHKSLETTKLYIGMAKKLNRAVEPLKVPAVLKDAVG